MLLSLSIHPARGSWGVGCTQNENMKLRPQTSTSSTSALSGYQVPLWEAPLKCPWVTFDLTREVRGTGKDSVSTVMVPNVQFRDPIKRKLWSALVKVV